jgi:hypothetical protein
VPNPSVFVGSSSETRDVAEVVVSLLSTTFTTLGWWNAFAPSTFSLESLEEAVRQNQFAVFVGRAEDLLESRGRIEGVVRTNVLGEFLMFVGANGRDHTYLLLDRSNLPDLPSDLDGLVYETFSYADFRANPSAAVRSACDRIARRISEIHAKDVAEQRDLEQRAMAEKIAHDLLDLSDTVSLLRDVVDTVQRDSFEVILDETRFRSVKEDALGRIEEIARPSEDKARSAGVGTEFAELKQSILVTVSALPFPRDVFAGIDDARAAYDRSILASVPALADAIKRKDVAEAFRIAADLNERASPEALLEEVMSIADERLTRLKNSYARWWKANSRRMRAALSGFQQVLMRAQTRNALLLAREARLPAATSRDT